MSNTMFFNPTKYKEGDYNAYLYIVSELKRGELVNDRYRIEKDIGQGGAGIVYKAFDIVLNNVVALKFLNPELTSSNKKFHRIKNEVLLSRKITDERIVKIYSIEKWYNVYFLVMEFIEGENLKNYIKKNGKYSWQEFKQFFYEILEGVKTLHKKNIIHRDLKPSNILITKDKKIKIVDFGLSKDIEDTTKTSSIGEITGTPDYITPEQIKGIRAGFYSDIYQLGVILYSVLTDKKPFDGYSTTLEMIYMKASLKPKKIKPNKNIPDYIVFAIEKAMEIEPKNRFKSVDEFERFIKKEKVGIMDKTIRLLSGKLAKKAMFFFAIVFIVSIFLFMLKNNGKISKIEYKKSVLEVYNPYGIKLFKKDFFPYVLSNVRIMKIKSTENSNLVKKNVIIAFLNHKDYRIFPDKGSINSNPTDARIIYLSASGKILTEKTDIMRDASYEFARKYYFSSYKEFKIRKQKFLIAYLKHFGGMFPSALIIFKENGFPAFFYNPGMMNYDIISQNNKEFFLLISGLNNLFSHLSFFMRVKLEPDMPGDRIAGNRIMYTIPQLNETRELYFKGLLFFLSRHSYFVKAKGINNFEFLDYKTGTKTVLIIKKRKVIMNILNGDNKGVYADDLNELNRVYYLINNYFYSAMIDKDYIEASKILDKIIIDKIKNPFLKSAIYYFKGVADLKTGNFKTAEKKFNISLLYEPENSDSAQRLCELEFLKGNYKKVFYFSDIRFKNIGEFWGLTHMTGKSLFNFYIYLHRGKFDKAEKIIKNPIIKLNQNIMRGLLRMFKGDYEKSFEYFIKELNKKPGIHKIVEYRLFYIRAAILYELFSEKNIKKNERFIQFANFYTKDIYNSSNYEKKFTGLPMAYYLLKKGDRTKAEKLSKEYFNKLLNDSKTDFVTKLWFFCDSFLYGKIMESLGNKREAIRGYELSIKSNPYADLAKRAFKRIEK